MPYRFLADESVAGGLHRIGREQVDRAVEEIEDSGLGLHSTVHQVRKRCKKLRGLLRLARGSVGETYSRENAFFRDLARKLSGVRDAEAMIEAFDALVGRFGESLEEGAFAAVREALMARRDRLAEEGTDLEGRLERVRVALVEARPRPGGWTLDDEGFAALAGGLKKTYRRALERMDEAYAEPSVERFHEWRKRVKYHGYHCRLLVEVWRPVMEPRRDAADELSGLLGDDHDLAVLRARLSRRPEVFGGSVEEAPLFLDLLDRRRAELQGRSELVGRRLFAERPGALRRRLGAYWRASHASVAPQPC